MKNSLDEITTQTQPKGAQGEAHSNGHLTDLDPATWLPATGREVDLISWAIYDDVAAHEIGRHEWTLTDPICRAILNAHLFIYTSPNCEPHTPESIRDLLLLQAGATERQSECAVLTAAAQAVVKIGPPWRGGDPSREVKRLLRELGPGPSSGGFNLTDYGNAERFVSQHGQDVRHCYAWAQWLEWDGRRWQVDSTGAIERRAKLTTRSIYSEAAQVEDPDQRKALGEWARKTETKSRLQSMIDLARSEPGIPVLVEELDANPWLLNCQNGTLNLQRGVLRPHNSGDLLTKCVPVAYDPQAKCPAFLSFLSSIMGDRPALVEFLQRSIGYALTGDTREQILLLLYGLGANGKTTLLNLVAEMMGDYGQQTDTDALMAKQAGGINNDLARLRAARFVAAVETEEGRRLAEVKIKQLTGGDTVTARFLFQEFFEFKPQFKLFLATNHKPQIRGTDNAIWRRVRLVPFDVTFAPEQQDKTLPDKLRAELPGILNWAVQGCLKWQRTGLGLPDEVKAATAAYREEQDVVAAFLAECCVFDQHAQASAKDINSAYQDWCKASGQRHITSIELGKRLAERGLRAKKGTGGARKWLGLGLLEDFQPSLLDSENSGAFQKVAHSGAETDLIANNGQFAEEVENRATMRHSSQNAPLLHAADEE